MNVATYTNRGTAVTVKGVTQSVTNTSGDTAFLPDNTVIYTNLVVTNGMLEMHLVTGWDSTHGATNNARVTSMALNSSCSSMDRIFCP